ncbi:phosphopantothenoylcysteine decarboxylase [Pseudobacteriovorax antillogorgiicola]|uniref:Phosphopantothenate-cysteine ligase /Phosphopantothenoylcysteine decarboxylase n=1 Tax=Pseudobacteriovorax antillogorgiicola TaxID=1513793 RepID=A0A1Y6CBA0_9BACT|nr:phosphopantothenoylcysteine decarboxylase [Pseudobacteriovorax antillogorgiicola]TCS48636.1 phosphopantothenate-cysteine ligase /phosphopantothenoylcysteine decarboxylase [Pseudobacteriovorax antillogorgiicola]SMF55314.1 Phosphopantothenate-cysteine ligase /Phosphopantothenoylcysteine decarboxylase [Pseudobacteriovorax antillogorgiicola]
MASSDLTVERISDALLGKHIDVIVSGSIGAVESTRFVRSLRRLGARVTPWLTEGAKQFTTNTALSWASAEKVVESFSGDASHIGLADACVIAPASANIIAKIARGITDTPASALVASYLGQGKPVMFIPNMHESLSHSPFVKSNTEKIEAYCTKLQPRMEEGKLKFPEPAVLADQIAHSLNSVAGMFPAMVAMGTTRGYIDDVRYISNYSSGALGSKIAEELYRQGLTTYVVAGPSPIRPKAYSKLIEVDTNDSLERTSLQLVEEEKAAVVFASSVLDFIPDQKQDGKIKSSEDLQVSFVKTDKIIAKLKPEHGIKVGFKLEADLDEAKAKAIATDYMEKYSLSLMVLNSLKEVTATAHKAYIVSRNDKGDLQWTQKDGKQQIAAMIAKHIKLASLN